MRRTQDDVRTVGQVLSRRVGGASHGDFARAMAAVPPRRMLDEQLATDARAARDAIGSHLAYQGTYAVNSVQAVVTMVLLTFPRVSRIEAEMFPAVAEQSKVANYATDQLVYERTATELATLGTGWKLAWMVGRRQRRAARIFGRAMFAGSGWIALGGAVSTVLLGVALFLLVGSPAATVGSVCTFGEVIAGTPPVAAYRRFIETFRPETSRAPTADAPDGAPPEITRLSAHDLVVRYPGVDDPVLGGVSLAAERGQMIGIVGANGAGKTTLVRAMPDGLDAQLGPQFGGRGLSGGQRQRLALARIALRRAPIWVLDEPTSSVGGDRGGDLRGPARGLRGPDHARGLASGVDAAGHGHDPRGRRWAHRPVRWLRGAAVRRGFVPRAVPGTDRRRVKGMARVTIG